MYSEVPELGGASLGEDQPGMNWKEQKSLHVSDIMFSDGLPSRSGFCLPGLSPACSSSTERMLSLLLSLCDIHYQGQIPVTFLPWLLLSGSQG